MERAGITGTQGQENPGGSVYACRRDNILLGGNSCTRQIQKKVTDSSYKLGLTL